MEIAQRARGLYARQYPVLLPLRRTQDAFCFGDGAERQTGSFLKAQVARLSEIDQQREVHSFGSYAIVVQVGRALRRTSGCDSEAVAAAHRDAGAGRATHARPALDAVLAERVVADGEAHCRLHVGGERGVVVGDDQRVRAEAGAARVAGVLPPAVQTFLAHQPQREVEVTLVALDAQAAPGIDTGISQVPAPGRTARAR